MSKDKLTGYRALAQRLLWYGFQLEDPIVRKIAPWDNPSSISPTLVSAETSIRRESMSTFQKFPKSRVIRGVAGSVILNAELTVGTLPTLSDLESLAAAIVILERDPKAKLDLSTPQSVKTNAINAIVREYLNARRVRLPRHEPFQSSPLLTELFKLATGTETVRQGLFSLVKVPETGNLDSRWNHFLRLRLRKMVLQPKYQPKEAREVGDDLASCLDALSADRPTGWVEIFELFRAYANEQRLPLADFKKLISRAAREGRVELAPHNVPMMHSAEDMAKSAVRLGGFTFHLIRPRR